MQPADIWMWPLPASSRHKERSCGTIVEEKEIGRNLWSAWLLLSKVERSQLSEASDTLEEFLLTPLPLEKEKEKRPSENPNPNISTMYSSTLTQRAQKLV